MLGTKVSQLIKRGLTMLILLASILFYVLFMVAFIQKRRRQLQAQTIAIAKQRQQQLRQQEYGRF